MDFFTVDPYVESFGFKTRNDIVNRFGIPSGITNKNVTHGKVPESAAKAGVAEKWRISAVRSLSRKIFPNLVVHPHKSPLGDNLTMFARIMAFSLSKSTDKKRQINRRQVGQTGMQL
jgi:hypothetical protein